MGLKMIPILPSPDLEETLEFYQTLGFIKEGAWPREYLIVRRPHDSLELHFWFNPSVEPSTNDVACYVRVDTVAEARSLHDEWASVLRSGRGRLHPPFETDYGLLEFSLVDGHGNLIRIGGSTTSR